MSEPEQLSGGNVTTSVIRIGSTVRKPATLATPAVQALLAHLHAMGFDGAPQALGYDEEGRQILEFLPGTPWNTSHQNFLAALQRVGALIPSFHDAVASFTPPLSAKWDALSSPDEFDILCHNDLAPWNLVCGAARWAFIDWDNAAPGTRLWDLAWATLSFPPVEPGCNLSHAAQAIHAIAEGYRLEPLEYGNLLRRMAQRAQASSDLLTEGARTGRQPWARLHAAGHNEYWGSVSVYVAKLMATLESKLLSLHADRSD